MGQVERDRLVAVDGPRELVPVLRIGEALLECCAGKAQRAAGEDQSLEVEAAHQDLGTGIDLAKDVGVGNENVVENQFVGL